MEGTIRKPSRLLSARHILLPSSFLQFLLHNPKAMLPCLWPIEWGTSFQHVWKDRYFRWHILHRNIIVICKIKECPSFYEPDLKELQFCRNVQHWRWTANVTFWHIFSINIRDFARSNCLSPLMWETLYTIINHDHYLTWRPWKMVLNSQERRGNFILLMTQNSKKGVGIMSMSSSSTCNFKMLRHLVTCI